MSSGWITAACRLSVGAPSPVRIAVKRPRARVRNPRASQHKQIDEGVLTTAPSARWHSNPPGGRASAGGNGLGAHKPAVAGEVAQRALPLVQPLIEARDIVV